MTGSRQNYNSQMKMWKAHQFHQRMSKQNERTKEMKNKIKTNEIFYAQTL